MKLTNPTDDQLNAAFAEKVAGWRKGIGGWYPPEFDSHCDPLDKPWNFTASADAVLPWLEKCEDVEIHRVNNDGWQVSIMDVRRFEGGEESGVHAEAWEDTLARAIVIALLRARGVEVEFTK